jgi:hypothetical protein
VKKVSRDFIESALEERRLATEKFRWNGGEPFWDDFVELLVSEDFDLDNTPNYYVDNFIVNGMYGHIDDYRNDDETNEECIKRLKPLLVKDDYILLSWGIQY